MSETTRSVPPGGFRRGALGGAPVSSYFLLLVVAVALILVVSAGIIFYSQSKVLREQEGAQLPLVAALVNERVGTLIGFHARLLEGFVASRGIDQLFVADDQSGLRAAEQSLQQMLPSADRIHLLPYEWNLLANGDAESLSFASLNLSRLAEKSGRTVPAEVHQVGTSAEYIALVVPVRTEGGGKVVGTLHVALPTELIANTLNALATIDGWLAIRQVAREKQVDLAVIGNRGPESEVTSRRPVAGTIWEVVYGLAAEPPMSSGGLVSLTVMGAAAGLIILLLLLQSVRMKRALNSDLSATVGLTEKLLGGTTTGGCTKMRLSEFDNMQKLLLRLPRGLGMRAEQGIVGQSTAAVPAPGSGSAGLPSAGPSGGSTESPFGPHGIGGRVGHCMTEAFAYDLGRAIGSEAYEQGQQTVILSRDGRDSSAGLSAALCRGLEASGRDVVDIGMVPMPLLYFATHFLGSNSGVMVAGGCLPMEYNGVEVIIDGELLDDELAAQLNRRIVEGDLLEGHGSQQEQVLLPDYIGRVTSDVQLARQLKVVVDCGNGSASLVAPALLRVLDCEVVELYCEVDYSFPNHRPDPGRPENLAALIRTVKEQQADLGVAFDCDGDRFNVVDSAGNIIWPDRLLLPLARDVLSRQPGADVIYDASSSRHLAAEILSYGGRPIMWKGSAAAMREKMRQTGALLSGNIDGQLFFQERWYGFDDGIYSCARLLEVLSLEPLSTEELFGALPGGIATPMLSMTCPSREVAAGLFEQLCQRGEFGDGRAIDIDGLRVEFERGWGQVLLSSSATALRFRFEADTPQDLVQIQDLFRQQLMAVDSTVDLPF